MKTIIKVGTEIAELQRQYAPAAVELGKAAVQLEAIAQRQDARAKALAADAARAYALIREAFIVGEIASDSFIVKPDSDVGKYIKAQEASRDLLREALAKTITALSEARKVLGPLATAETVKGTRKK